MLFVKTFLLLSQKKPFIFCFALLTLVILICNFYFIVKAPIEINQGIIQKIFYIHLPFAWWGMISFLIVAVSSGFFLKSKKIIYDNIAESSAELGVLFTILALITGSIWAKRSWGIWWTWEPKLTTTLIMCFIYSTYLFIRQFDISQQKKAIICAILGIIAFIDVPLVFFATYLWRSLHPTVFINKSGGMPNEMFLLVLFSVFSFGLLFCLLFLLRFKQANLKDKIIKLSLNS